MDCIELFSCNFPFYSYCHLFYFIYYTDIYVSAVKYILAMFICVTRFATSFRYLHLDEGIIAE